jgi:D-amino-acid dehydrogenase
MIEAGLVAVDVQDALAALVEGDAFLRRPGVQVLARGACVTVLRDGVADIGVYDGVVVCAGTASRALAAMVGDRVNVYPVKGYSITVNLPDAASQAAAPTVSLLDDATKLVASRFGQDRLRVAGTAEFAGYDKDIRADRIRPLVDWVERCFPGVSTKSVVPWAGLRPMMPDTMPRVGRGRTPFVFYNTGHGHLGWTLSAATAEMVAHEVYAAVEPAAGRRRAALAA